MKIILNKIKKILILSLFLPNILLSTSKSITLEKDKIIKEEEKKQENQELVEFYFKDKKLIDLVDFIAKKKKINYVIPQNKSQQDKFKEIKVSYQPIGPKKIPFKKAWELTTLFLEHSGFSWFKKGENLYQISASPGAKDNEIFREPLPLYVNTKVEDLPNSEKRIRYIYYLANLKATDNDNDPLNQIIKEMSSPDSPKPFILPKTNGFMLIDKANVIASIINLISHLDSTGFRETIQVIQLNNVSASQVAKTFDNLKKAAGTENTSPFIRGDSKASISFFASDTQIIADPRNNALILMGRETAVDRIRDFINNHVDFPDESGKSILHYYDLQYLESKSFAVTLNQILNGSQDNKGVQGNEAAASLPERQFQGVAIVAEEYEEKKAIQGPLDTETVRTPDGQKYDAKGLQGTFLTGGNRLIIAAMHDDWVEIEKLIQQLDQPQPQVILEVLVADISHTKTKIISGDIRSRRMDNLINGFGFLSSNIGPVNSVTPDNIKTLATDLLGKPRSSSSYPNGDPITSLLEPGSFLLSFTDPTTPADGYSTSSTVGGAIWALIQVLDTYLDLRVMTHPFLVTHNNTKSTIQQAIIKRQRGSADPSQSGVIAVNIDSIPASIALTMLPRINSENRLSLQVAIDISDFTTSKESSNSTLTRETRHIETLANLNSGNVLVIGGLTNLIETDTIKETPFFGQIPLIGRFFQGVTKTTVASNIAIFIAPTIVMPRFRSGQHLHTKDQIQKSKSRLDNRIVYGDNRDPITYFFLPDRDANNQLVNEYLEQTINESQYQKEATADLIKQEEKREENIKIIENLKKTEPIEVEKVNKLQDLEEKNLTDVPA